MKMLTIFDLFQYFGTLQVLLYFHPADETLTESAADRCLANAQGDYLVSPR